MSYHCIKQGVLLIPRSSELSADLLPESPPCLLSITHHRVNEYLQLATIVKIHPTRSQTWQYWSDADRSIEV